MLPINHALSQRSTSPAIGQGSYAVLLGCLIPKTSVGRIVLEEERQHWSEVDRMRDQSDEVKSCAVAPIGGKDVRVASSQARRKFLNKHGMVYRTKQPHIYRNKKVRGHRRSCGRKVKKLSRSTEWKKEREERTKVEG